MKEATNQLMPSKTEKEHKFIDIVWIDNTDYEKEKQKQRNEKNQSPNSKSKNKQVAQKSVNQHILAILVGFCGLLEVYWVERDFSEDFFVLKRYTEERD